jgi:hypothetical protein
MDIKNPYNKDTLPDSFEFHAFNEGVDAAIAARDKWWVEWLDKLFHNLLPYICLERDYLQCETCPEMRKEVCAYNVWQSRRKEIGL